MSFKCDRCKIPQEPGAKPHIVPIKWRHKIYPERKIDDIVIDPGGVGSEIVKEAHLCNTCYEEVYKRNPEDEI